MRECCKEHLAIYDRKFTIGRYSMLDLSCADRPLRLQGKMPRGALIVATAAVAISACSAGSAPLTKLTDQRAKCMDGTLSGYYYQQSSTSRGSTKWVLFLEGGGECASEQVRVFN